MKIVRPIAITDTLLEDTNVFEGPRTNLCLQSADFSTTWTPSNITVTTNNTTDPVGVTTTADLLTATAANGTIIQDLGAITSAVKTFSVYLKRKTGTGNIQLTLNGGTAWTTVTVTTSWVRYSLTATLADPDIGIRIVTSGDEVWATWAQCEAFGYVTDYIATTTAAVTINDEAPLYNSGTTYSTGNQVLLVSTHKIYESLRDTNTNNNPPDNLTGLTPYWMEVSATNLWKSFDAKIGSQTINSDLIILKGSPGEVADSMAMMNVEAADITVLGIDPVAGTVYDRTFEMILTTNVIDGYTYCFEPIIRKTDLVVTDLPPYPSIEYTVTIDFQGEDAKIGEFVIGLSRFLGTTMYSPRVGVLDYSRKEVDSFGNYSVLERAFSKRLSCDLIVDNSLIDETNRLLAFYRATPVVWIGSDLYSSMLIYGFYKSFDIIIPQPTVSQCSLEIEGLT